MKLLYTLLVGVILTSSAYAQESVIEDIIKTDSTTNSTVTTKSDSTTTLKSPPPSAISPTINTSNSDLCTFGVAGAVQTQILGISAGTQFTDYNCEKLKNAKTLYDMGMKVAAVSVMCQDRRVFDAMMNAGTPCPYDGMIGEEAKLAWEAELAAGGSPEVKSDKDKEKEMTTNEKTLAASGGIGALLLLLLL